MRTGKVTGNQSPGLAEPFCLRQGGNSRSSRDGERMEEEGPAGWGELEDEGHRQSDIEGSVGRCLC